MHYLSALLILAFAVPADGKPLHKACEGKRPPIFPEGSRGNYSGPDWEPVWTYLHNQYPDNTEVVGTEQRRKAERRFCNLSKFDRERFLEEVKKDWDGNKEVLEEVIPLGQRIIKIATEYREDPESNPGAIKELLYGIGSEKGLFLQYFALIHDLRWPVFNEGDSYSQIEHKQIAQKGVNVETLAHIVNKARHFKSRTNADHSVTQGQNTTFDYTLNRDFFVISEHYTDIVVSIRDYAKGKLSKSAKKEAVAPPGREVLSTPINAGRKGRNVPSSELSFRRLMTRVYRVLPAAGRDFKERVSKKCCKENEITCRAAYEQYETTRNRLAEARDTQSDDIQSQHDKLLKYYQDNHTMSSEWNPQTQRHEDSYFAKQWKSIHTTFMRKKDEVWDKAEKRMAADLSRTLRQNQVPCSRSVRD